jgi:hypothetical protein
MTGTAVQLDAQLVPVIEVVQIPDARGELAPCLPTAAGQAVSALDVAHIAALQRKHGSFRDVI